MTIKSSLSIIGAVALALGGASLAVAQYPATSTPPATAMPPAMATAMSSPSMSTSEYATSKTGNMNSMQNNSVNLSKSRIREIQKALKGLGYYLQVDGIWGEGTVDDIKDVQFKNGLNVTGKPDANTLRALGLKGQGEMSSGMHHAPTPSTNTVRNARRLPPAMQTDMAPSEMTMSPVMGTS